LYFYGNLKIKTMRKVYVLLMVILMFATTGVFAQYENLSADTTKTDSSAVVETPQKKVKKKQGSFKRIYLGGNLGGGWSNYGGYFNISPTIYFLVTQKLHFGVRFTYIYSSYKDYNGHKENYNDYGASILARYHFLKFLYAHAEFQELNFDKGDSREWIPALFLGGGLYQHFGAAYMHVGIMWNVLDNDNASYNSPYSNPMLTVGFGVGL
jgi:hypothetical protein